MNHKQEVNIKSITTIDKKNKKKSLSIIMSLSKIEILNAIAKERHEEGQIDDDLSDVNLSIIFESDNDTYFDKYDSYIDEDEKNKNCHLTVNNCDSDEFNCHTRNTEKPQKTNCDMTVKINELNCDMTVNSPLIPKYDSKNPAGSPIFILRSKINIIYTCIYNHVIMLSKKKKETKAKKKKEIQTAAEVVVNDNDFREMPKASKTVLAKMKSGDDKANDVAKWTSNQFAKYMAKKFRDTYQTNSIEFDNVNGGKAKMATGRKWTIIKQRLLNVFYENEMTNQDVVHYIDWVFDNKSKKMSFPVNLGFLCSNSVITEWTVSRSKQQVSKKEQAKIKYDL